jgi:membrane protein
VAINWVRRYREADGQLYAVLLTAYVFVTLLPVAIVMETYVYGDPTALADHLVTRLSLRGPAATFVGDVITGAGSNKLGSALIAIANVVIVGLGFGRVLQLAYSRSWRLDVPSGMITDQLRYAAALFVPMGGLLLYLIQTRALEGRSSWIEWMLAPTWAAVIVAYFVWLPRLLLHKRVSVRDVLPGAVLITVALGVMRVISSFLLTRWLVWYSQYYGGFGVVMALFFWLMIAMTILVVAAALSPALAERRNLLETAR